MDSHNGFEKAVNHETSNKTRDIIAAFSIIAMHIYFTDFSLRRILRLLIRDERGRVSKLHFSVYIV